VPPDTAGELVGAGDFQAQARQVFVNLKAAPEAAGVGWNDVVKLNFFVTDLSEISGRT
jgi:enamine deaminase RidA (YjgF/YER057c/UK114 family)